MKAMASREFEAFDHQCQSTPRRNLLAIASGRYGPTNVGDGDEDGDGDGDGIPHGED